jgi:tetratricopeptide (TPR) repeat protein
MTRLPLLIGVVITLAAAGPAGLDQSLPPVHTPLASYLEDLAQARAETAAKHWPQAAALWAKVTEANPCAGSFWSSLAVARYEAKDYRAAIPAYEKALELRFGFPWGVAYNIACCQALLGDKKQALEWLEKSFAMGCRDVARAQTDKDLASLRGEPRYRALVGLVDVSKMSRDEGWRYDLAWLAREIKRIHYSPFKKVSRQEFDSFVEKLSNDIPHLSDAQIAVGFMKLARLPGDGHTVITPNFIRRETRRAAPIRLYLFAEGLYVTAAGPGHSELVGALVLKIGEHSADAILEAMESVISQDNKMWPKWIGPDLMTSPQLLNGMGLIPDPEKLPLTVRDQAGNERTIELAAEPIGSTESWANARQGASRPLPLYLKNQKTAYWFEYLPEQKTLYMQYNAVRNEPKEPLDRFCARVFEFINQHDVDKLVIDMRLNGGGNNFLNKPLVHGLVRCDKVNQKGKLFVIVGRRTFSAAMNGATDIERETEAIFVGEPTGSCPNFVGESVPVFLPYSKMRGSISDLYWQRSVAMDYRTWIPPTIYTPPTFADYSSNRDPAMEAVLAYRATANDKAK